MPLYRALCYVHLDIVRGFSFLINERKNRRGCVEGDAVWSRALPVGRTLLRPEIRKKEPYTLKACVHQSNEPH